MIGSVTTLGLSGVSIGDLYDWSSGTTTITAFVPPQFRIDTNSTNAVARAANQAIQGSETEAIERA